MVYVTYGVQQIIHLQDELRAQKYTEDEKRQRTQQNDNDFVDMKEKWRRLVVEK